MKIALFGATGRLGRAIAALIALEKDLALSEAIAHPQSPSLGQLLDGISIQGSFENRSDILIDVSLPKSFPSALSVALLNKKPIVIGQTGLSIEQLSQIRSASRTIPIFYSPNFSLGMAIFRQIAREATKRFYSSSSADIIETHHLQKKDAPSGSALLIEQELAHLGKKANIHSIRSGKIVGEHTLILNSDEERLEISHKAHSRDAFARGALIAARFVFQKKPFLYGMDDLLI